jgi:hypothetical protein
MQEKHRKWIDYLYGPYFKVAGFFYRIFSANRARVERLKSSERVAAVLRFLSVAVVVVWILIWLFASDDSRNRLTEEMKQTIGGFERSDAAPDGAE